MTAQVDDIAALGDLCQRRGAWFHVDAIWGAAVAYSTVAATRELLNGLSCADSVALGPQKWMFAPRLCALTLFPKMRPGPEFDATLAAVMPSIYSARRDEDDGSSVVNANRGTWGLQGSRRADCLALFATLQVLGREGMGRYVDDSIALTREFHATVLARLGVDPVQTSNSERLRVAPTHTPQLNLLNLRVNGGASVISVTGAFTVLVMHILALQESETWCWRCKKSCTDAERPGCRLHRLAVNMSSGAADM